MTLSLDTEALIHPIDVIESLAEHRQWNFDRIGDDRIALEVEGRWQVYSLSVVTGRQDAVLRLAASFALEVPQARRACLHEVLNAVNDGLWLGAFSWWESEALMVYRTGLPLDGGVAPEPAQIERLLQAALEAAERFYPVFQVASWGAGDAADALALALPGAVGSA